jgi:hypothetical protein
MRFRTEAGFGSPLFFGRRDFSCRHPAEGTAVLSPRKAARDATAVNISM